MAAILLRTTPFSQRAQPLAVVVGGCRLTKPASRLELTPSSARARLTAVRTTAPWPDSPRAGSRHANPVAAMEGATAMESAAPAGHPLRLRSGSHSGLEACGSHNFPQPGRRVNQEPWTCRAGSGCLVKTLPQPAAVHGPSANRLGIRLACLDQGPADPDRALARSLRCGQPSSGRACFHRRPIRSNGIRCRP